MVFVCLENFCLHFGSCVMHVSASTLNVYQTIEEMILSKVEKYVINRTRHGPGTIYACKEWSVIANYFNSKGYNEELCSPCKKLCFPLCPVSLNVLANHNQTARIAFLYFLLFFSSHTSKKKI